MATSFLRVEIDATSVPLRFDACLDLRRSRAVAVECDPGEREVGMGQSVARIACESLLEEGTGLLIVVFRIAPEMHDAAQEEVVGGEADRRLAQRLPEFCVLDPPDERRHDRRRDLVLNLEYLCQLAIVALRPDMRAARRFDKLGGDANAVARAPDAALQEDTKRRAAVRSRSGSTALPRNANDELRATTKSERKRASPVMMSSVMPSLKKVSSAWPLRLSKGRTAIDGRSGSGRLGRFGRFCFGPLPDANGPGDVLQLSVRRRRCQAMSSLPATSSCTRPEIAIPPGSASA